MRIAQDAEPKTSMKTMRWLAVVASLGCVVSLAFCLGPVGGGSPPEVLNTMRRADRLCSMAKHYKQTHGSYPVTLKELAASEEKATGLLKDCWDRDMAYRITTAEAGEIEVRSAGADGLMNTGDDIVSTVNLTHEFKPNR